MFLSRSWLSTDTEDPMIAGPMLRHAANPRAAYASDAAKARGRLVPEKASATRTEFQRDRDRVIHSGAFRRLALKTQVFLPEEGDVYRTRLTHTIEVAQIARTIARALGLDEDLTEALALAHDLGHSPFGHTGEDALDEAVAAAGGFDHNAQTIRILTELERRYPMFDGLNLTWETLEGLAKRKGPLESDGAPITGKAIPAVIRKLDAQAGLALDTFASAEAQAAAVADDIAYNAHDIEDGLEAALFDLADLGAVPFLAGTLADIAVEAPGLDRERTIRALARTLVGVFVEDAISESSMRLRRAAPRDAWEVRRLPTPVVGLSSSAETASREIKHFLLAHMYRHPRILQVRAQTFAIVTDLARRLVAAPEQLPEQWARQAVEGAGAPKTMRLVADYIAGLTDRGAIAEHRRLFRTTPDLR